MDNSPKTLYNQKKLVTVNTKEIACPPLGQPARYEHPRMYLLIQSKQVTCPYCETTYVYKEPPHE